jgi:hypothetical protein
MRPWVLVVMLAGMGSVVGAGTGCREPALAARDGGADVPECSDDAAAPLCDVYSQDNAMFTWAKATCGLLLDCCASKERSAVAELLLTRDGLSLLLLREPAMLVDATACRRALTTSLFVRFRQNYEALEDGRQRFNIEAARECLSWFEAGAAQCAPGLVLLGADDEPRACGRMFAPDVAEGGECFGDADCVAAADGGRSVCESRTARLADGGLRFAVAGRCRPVPNLGETCPLPDSDCGGGRYCSVIDGTCHLRAGAGALCVAQPCDEASYCDATAQLPTCVARGGLLAPCAAEAPCQSGLTCNASLAACLDETPACPLDISFELCLGEGGVSVARTLPFVPQDGGL